MSEKMYDLIVLGGGNAVSLGIRAAAAGQSVAVIEADLLGGTCPNRGCIPSKLLLGYAEVATAIREAGRFHLQATLDGADRDAMLRETQAATIDATDGKIAGNLPESVDLFRGHGRFVGPRSLEVDGQVIRGRRVIIGTGTRPRRPVGFDDIPYWTSDDVFSMDRVPESIAIIGGGYIGCELAWFFASVGVKTTVLVRGDTLLPAEDRDIRKLFREGFCEQVDVRFGVTTKGARMDGEETVLELDAGGKSEDLRVEKALFAIGRVPNSDDIGLDAAGIATNERGFIQVDDRMATNVEGVFALGDVIGRYFFTHSAAWEAIYLGDVWLEGKEGGIEYGPMPHAVFSHPEVAGVGKTEDELEKEGADYRAASLPFTSAAKGRAVKERHGLCKFLLAPDGTILGCHIVGHQASILLHQVLPVMRLRNHIDSLTDMIYIHPSLSEVVRNTARKAKASLG